MSSTTYITSPRNARKSGGNKVKLAVSLTLALFMAFMVVVSSLVSVQTKKAEALDVTHWVLCSILPDPAPLLYQYSQSDDIPFLLRSKSVISAGSSDVETGLNWVLDNFGPGFKKVNEDITSQSTDISVPDKKDEETPEPPVTDDDDEKDKNYNNGVKVTPFDRFGVAGLNFTAYNGEWKYIVTDACQEGSEPTDPKAGAYYKDRLEPRSTWDDMHNSTDIRTVQFTKGFLGQMLTAINDVVANGIFTITKTIVVVTIGLINFAFSDVTEIIGMNELIGSNGGIFDMLFNGIFTPLIVMVFVLTGIHIFYLGIVKRSYRNSMNILFRSVALFIIAIVISSNPAFWIGIPNKVAVAGQAIIISALNTDLSSGDGLCATDVGSKKFKLVDSKAKDDADLLNKASENMRAAIGCTFWETFLVRPWSEGQFGVDYNKLWAKDKIPSWAPKGSAALNNSNVEMVGEAEVPVGNKKVLNNWALYQISTQTNVHVPTGHEGTPAQYSSNIANDWWRIVDAMANYDEEEKTETIRGNGKHNKDQEIKYTAPKASNPMPYWDDWVGNNSMNRVGVASGSVFIAGIGTALPLVFGLMSAVYAFGLTLLMAFAPIMLLLGCWSSRGWEIFKGWGELVLNTLMKRIAIGLLLGLSITFTVKIIKMMESIPWWQGVMLLMLVTLLLFKIRHKVMDIFASFKFSSSGMGNTAGRISQKISNTASNYSKNAGKLAVGAVAGGVGAKMAGGTVKQGMGTGMKKEFENLTFRSNNKFLSHARMTKDAFKGTRTGYDDGELFSGSENCGICGKRIEVEEDQNGSAIFHGGRKSDGTIICFECFQDGVDPDASEIILRREMSAPEQIGVAGQDSSESSSKIKSKYDNLFKGSSNFKRAYSQNILNDINNTVGEAYRKVNGKREKVADQVFNDKDRDSQLIALSKSINYDITNHMKGDETLTPEIPDFLNGYLDKTDLNFAWETKNYEFIQTMYAAAILEWYHTTYTDRISNLSIGNLKQAINNEIDSEAKKKKDKQEEEKKNNN